MNEQPEWYRERRRHIEELFRQCKPAKDLREESLSPSGRYRIQVRWYDTRTATGKNTLGYACGTVREAKTGRVRLPGGLFVVPEPYVGPRRSHQIRSDPLHSERAFLIDASGHEIELAPFQRRPLPPVSSPFSDDPARRGTGQLQKLVDLWRGSERPNAQPGFGLPEVFRELGTRLGREVPGSENEALQITAFYRRHGPLPRQPFLDALQHTFEELGARRALKTYLDHLVRQVQVVAGTTEAPKPSTDHADKGDPAHENDMDPNPEDPS